jgi:hypothetical protein
MALLAFPVRRLILAGAFTAAATMSPALAVLAGPVSNPGAAVATCPAGESEDPFTYSCVPELVPNGTTSGTSEQQLTQCTGIQADCREQEFYGTPPLGA